MNGMRGYEARNAACHRDTSPSRKEHFGCELACRNTLAPRQAKGFALGQRVSHHLILR
jgi:hypothetical protein